jgi:chaperonin GroEL
MIKQAGIDVRNQVTMMAAPFTKDMVLQVARTSLGDQALGRLVEEIFTKLGSDAGVLVESSGGSDIYSEIVDGFYFNKGFTALALVNDPSNLRSYHEGNVPILISEKRLLVKTDAGPILETLLKERYGEVIVVGECSPEVLDVFYANKLAGSITVTAVDAPVYEGLRTLFMNDLALLTDATVYTPGSNPSDFNTNMLGYAKKVVIDATSTKIIGADGSAAKVKGRIKELKAQLKEATHQFDITILRERISRLNGKLAIIHVGSATEVEREEVKLRIDDAVCAIRAAYKEGVVPGGGVTLARVDAGLFTSAYTSLIKCLAENCGLNPEGVLQDVQKAKVWYGYDFKNLTTEPVDLRDAGILDPTLVITEMVKNATSIASTLIDATTGTALVDRDSKQD